MVKLKKFGNYETTVFYFQNIFRKLGFDISREEIRFHIFISSIYFKPADISIKYMHVIYFYEARVNYPEL